MIERVWSIRPASLAFVPLIATECGLAAFCLQTRGRVALLLGVVFLLLVSSSPTLQLLTGDTGSCGCGPVTAEASFFTGATFALFRNAVASAALLLTLFITRGSSR